MPSTAHEIARNVCLKELSALKTLEEHLSAIDSLEPRIEAWVCVDRKGARLFAKSIDDTQDASGALLGVPVGIKDIFDAAGLVTTCGAGSFAHYTPAVDAACVQRLKDAGAVIVGKTHTTEFAMLDNAPTHNPWNLDHTPGGSSSGSAAAVAAGMVPVALGSQTVGSVLRPAAYCGVVGFKPSHGRISLRGVFPLAPSLDHVGIFSRNVLDAAIVLGAIAGFDAADALSADRDVDDYALATASARPPVLGLPFKFFRDRAGPEVTAHIEAVAAQLAEAGAVIQDIEMPLSAQEIRDLGEPVFSAQAASVHAQSFAKNRDAYRPHIREHIEKGMAITAVEYLQAQGARRQLRQQLTDLLGPVDALLFPSAPATAPAGLESTGDGVFCAPASFTGLPAISLPSGVAADGLPLAVQLMGGAFAEARLLGVAAWVEQVLAFDARPSILAS